MAEPDATHLLLIGVSDRWRSAIENAMAGACGRVAFREFADLEKARDELERFPRFVFVTEYVGASDEMRRTECLLRLARRTGTRLFVLGSHEMAGLQQVFQAAGVAACFHCTTNTVRLLEMCSRAGQTQTAQTVTLEQRIERDLPWS